MTAYVRARDQSNFSWRRIFMRAKLANSPSAPIYSKWTGTCLGPVSDCLTPTRYTMYIFAISGRGMRGERSHATSDQKTRTWNG